MMKITNFRNQATEYLLGIRCVAHLYFRNLRVLFLPQIAQISTDFY